jgi:non-heme chloroperoxidase
MASMLALGDNPGLPVAGLVLVDIAHRFEAAGTQRILDFMGGAPDGFATPQEANEAVSRYLPHRRPPADTSGIEKNLRLHDGRWQWHWDPKLMGVTGLVLEPTRVAELEARLTTSLAELAIPVLLIRGMISDVVSRPIADEFTALVPHSRVVEVERASHMVAGDDNDRFAASVIGFIDELAATSSRS